MLDGGGTTRKKILGPRLTSEQREIIARRLEEGAGLTLLSREFGVSRGAIYNVKVSISK